MALVTPLLLLLILGISSVGHAMIVRFILSSSAYDAARTCALARNVTNTCVNTVVSRKTRNVRGWCNGGSGPTARARATRDPNFPSVNSLDVTVTCAYGFAIGGGFLRSQGVVLTTIAARAAMPY